MAQLSMADILKGIKKDDSVVEDPTQSLAENVNFPSFQNLINPKFNSPYLPEYAKEGLVNSDKYADVRSDYNTDKANNLNESNDFISKMLDAKKPIMLQEGLVPPVVTSQPKMAPEEMEAPVIPSAKPTAPVSGTKQSFQSTQSPEQKLVAQAAADQQNPLVDTEMKAALAEAKQQAETNQRRKGLFEMMAGIGSLGGSELSAESESLDNAIKMQNAPVEQVTQERDAYKKFLANNEEMEKADPNSPVSKTMRDALSGMGVKIPANASYATMENLAPQLMKNKEFQMRMQEMDLKRQELSQNKEAQKSLKADQQIAKTRDSVLKSERYKNLAASTEAIQGARSNLELARKGYSQGYSALGANLAKLAGEKGMLSEADVNRYLVAKGVPGKLESGKLELTGKPTKQQIDALEQIVNSLESDVRKKGVQFAEDELSGYSQGLNVTPEQIESVLPELKRLKAGATVQPKTNKPKTIKQNGHTYTLNESTGEYE